MEKLRRLGTWFWRYKERVVLAAMVCVWGLRVYRVLEPEKISSERPPSPPKSEVPEGMIPGAPPLMVERDRPMDVSSLVRMNPFTAVGGGGAAESATRTEDPGISLQKITRWRDGSYRAEVVTKTSKTFRVSEGEQFENFTVNRIDPDTNTVEVFSNELDKTIVLRAQ